MIVVGITGASGSIIGIRLIEELLKGSSEEVVGIVSEAGWAVMSHELRYRAEGETPLTDLLRSRGNRDHLDNFRELGEWNLFAPPASGSSSVEAVIVAPSSMKSLSAIANGYADSLITRACDVALKQRRQCIIVPRETPLNLIHIENMRKATLAGAVIAPPMPGFYTHPQTIDDVVDFVVGKILNLLGRTHNLFQPWPA